MRSAGTGLSEGSLAPEIDAVQWFNVEVPPTLAGLRGRVVVLHAFQMLCPGCVQTGLPQAQRIAGSFGRARWRSSGSIPSSSITRR